MSHQVIWTKIILEEFVKEANLTPFQEHIMRTRCAGWSRTRQAFEFHCSLSTIDRTIKELKLIYDATQKNNPLLPPRKPSEKELWMDTQ